jgi:hypothetical protein
MLLMCLLSTLLLYRRLFSNRHHHTSPDADGEIQLCCVLQLRLASNLSDSWGGGHLIFSSFKLLEHEGSI